MTDRGDMSDAQPRTLRAIDLVRCAIGGVLMGIANVIPGVSGGTMLLASGVYRMFIEGVAAVTTLRFRITALVPLGIIGLTALAAIAILAKPIADLVVNQRWIMYAIFIGLTLGGVPIIWRLARPVDARVLGFAAIGIAVMAAMAFIGPADSAAASSDGPSPVMLVLAGIAAASAMVLPGVSGSYLLLVLGQYVTILTAVATLKDVARGNEDAVLGDALRVVVPVAIGVMIGIAGVSNLIRVLLARYERATLGVLMGLLIGAVIGLYPFQRGEAPAVGSIFRGDRVVEVDGVLQMEQAEREIEAADWPTSTFAPNALQIGSSLALIVAGFLASVGIGRVGANETSLSE